MSGQGISANLARAILGLRGAREVVLGIPASGTRAWDVILVLYLADAEGRRLTGREAIVESGAGFEAGRRWLSYLSQAGIVVGDGHLNEDVIVTLAPHAVTRMEEFIDHARAIVRDPG